MIELFCKWYTDKNRLTQIKKQKICVQIFILMRTVNYFPVIDKGLPLCYGKGDCAHRWMGSGSQLLVALKQIQMESDPSDNESTATVKAK